MVGDDACVTFVEMLKKILEIAKAIEENKKGKAVNRIKYPKIKFGKLSKADFRKLQKAGSEFKYVTVPAEKLPEIEENIKKMGGSYFMTEIGDSNNAVIAVPASQLDMLQAAMKHAVGKELENDPGKIVVKDGKDLINAEDIGIVSRVMNKHDIPVISFKTEDDKYMNFVPKDFEGQYSKAMKEAEAVKQEVANIDVTRYDQTAPLDDLGYRYLTRSQ